MKNFNAQVIFWKVDNINWNEMGLNPPCFWQMDDLVLWGHGPLISTAYYR